MTIAVVNDFTGLNNCLTSSTETICEIPDGTTIVATSTLSTPIGEKTIESSGMAVIDMNEVGTKTD